MSLPKNVYLKHGAYYLARNGKWIRLTPLRSEIPAALARLNLAEGASREEIAEYAKRQLARSRANAKGRRGLEHALVQDDISRMLDECNYRCSVTGVPYSLAVVGPRKQLPYAPSIDRKDNDVGYLASNCRMVCAAANIAMNTWGEDVLRTLLMHARSSRILDVP